MDSVKGRGQAGKGVESNVPSLSNLRIFKSLLVRGAYIYTYCRNPLGLLLPKVANQYR